MTSNSYMKVHYTSSVTVKLIGMRLLYRMMKVRNDMPRFCAFLPEKKVNTHVINTLYLKKNEIISSWILNIKQQAIKKADHSNITHQSIQDTNQCLDDYLKT